jgi:hypothetical protein
MRKLGIGLALLTITGAAACGPDVGDDVSYEKWNRKNDPASVDPNFKYNVDELPLVGEAAQSPIPADYWATYKDSINKRWDGDNPSPAEKYGQAFGIDGLEDIVSSNYGIDRNRGSRKSCKTSSDCSDLEDGSSCSRRRGEGDDVDGVCIPSWWGMCHGWAPYAISEPAAVKPAEYNGVTFYPGDIEALMSLVYGTGLHVKFLSERCNENKPKPGDDGRIPDDECRDMNPGSLHVVATNLLGLRSEGFVEDRTYDLQVWNQPVKGYEVENATEDGKLKEITKAEAVALLDLPEGSAYTYNPDARRFFHVKLALHWITEAGPSQSSHVGDDTYTRTDRYEYILETDAEGDIFGGEYVGSSRTFHPDFVWWPTAKPTGYVADGKITYANVAKLNELAQEQGGEGGGGGGEPVPTGDCAHSECEQGEKLVADCSPCAKAVCDQDDYCCSTEWDSLCVEAAQGDASCGCGE